MADLPAAAEQPCTTPVLRPCMNCLEWKVVDDGSDDPDRICMDCHNSLSQVPPDRPALGPSLRRKVRKITCPREVIGKSLLKKAGRWANRNGEKLKARDRKVVEEARAAVQKQRRSGKTGDVRMAGRLPGRWFAEKRLLLGEELMHDPERIVHEAKKDNLWFERD